MFTIYTNHRGGNPVHRLKSLSVNKICSRWENKPLQSISKSAEQPEKNRKIVSPQITAHIIWSYLKENARTIWFSNRYFRLSCVNGKHLPCNKDCEVQSYKITQDRYPSWLRPGREIITKVLVKILIIHLSAHRSQFFTSLNLSIFSETLLERTLQNASKITARTTRKKGRGSWPRWRCKHLWRDEEFTFFLKVAYSLSSRQTIPLLDVLPFKCNQMYSSPKIFCILCFLAQLLETDRYEDHHVCFSSTTSDRLWYDGAQSSVSHDPSW